MRTALVLTSIAFLLLPLAAWGESSVPHSPTLEADLVRDPYAYRGRQGLVNQYRDSGDHPAAYYHAAWLAWLAPREYADSEAGLAFLRDRSARDSAARLRQAGPLSAVIAAVNAKQILYNTCFNGTIAPQADRLTDELADLLVRAEQAALQAAKNDPVARIALAHLTLTLDDALVFQDTSASRRARLPVLRKAASRAAAVAAWLPKCPGPHRTLAMIRARLAEMDNRTDLWDLAIAEAERAHELDPGDADLNEMLWVLHLRAGHWTEARRWQTRLKAPAGECPP